MANFQIIRDLCRERGISLLELGKKVGKSDSQIHNILRNNSTSLETLEQFAKVLNVPASTFFPGDPSKESLLSENAHLKKLLAEKERLIEVLLEEKSKGKS